MSSNGRKNLAILASGEFLTRGISFLAFAHLARTLGPDGFGKLEFVLAWVMFGIVLIESGVQTIGARDVAIDKSSTPRLFSRILPIQFSVALVSVLVCAWLKFTGAFDPITSNLLLGYSVSLLAVPFFLTWAFQGQQRMVWVSAPQVMRQLVFLVAAFLVVRSTADILWLPYVEIGSVLVAACICLAAYYRTGSGFKLANPMSPESRTLVKDAATIGLSQVLWFVRMYLPIVLLKFLMDDEAVGRFGVAHRIVNVFQAAVTVYWLAFFPQLSEHAGKPTLQSTLLKSLSAAGLLTCLGAVVVSAFATQTLQFAFGTGYSISVAATVLAILVWRVPIIMFRSHARQALFVLGHLNTELICSLLSVVVLVPLAYWATQQYGIMGLAIAATVSELVGAIATWMVWMYVWRGARPLPTVLRYE